MCTSCSIDEVAWVLQEAEAAAAEPVPCSASVRMEQAHESTAYAVDEDGWDNSQLEQATKQSLLECSAPKSQEEEDAQLEAAFRESLFGPALRVRECMRGFEVKGPERFRNGASTSQLCCAEHPSRGLLMHLALEAATEEVTTVAVQPQQQKTAEKAKGKRGRPKKKIEGLGGGGGGERKREGEAEGRQERVAVPDPVATA